MNEKQQRRIRPLFISALLLMILAGISGAQISSAYVYPFKNQTQEQQTQDCYECHSWAVQQTGYDPSRAYPNNSTYLDPQPSRSSQPHVLRGAERGSALGAVGAAITGNAGKGAAAGAAMGGLAGGFRKLDQSRANGSATAVSPAAIEYGRGYRLAAGKLRSRNGRVPGRAGLQRKVNYDLRGCESISKRCALLA